MQEIIDQKMQDWRDGLVSNGETAMWLVQLSHYVLGCQAEMAKSVLDHETKVAEARLERRYTDGV